MIWKNTKILDEFLDESKITEEKEKAEILLIGGGNPIDISDFPNAKKAFRAGVGTDNINFSNIPVRLPSEKTKSLIYEETANFACFLMFRMLYEGIGNLDSWKGVSRNTMKRKTLLVIGKGNIGGRVCEKMSSFMNVESYDAKDDAGYHLPVSLDKSDIISLHIPYNNENKNRIDKDFLDKIKNDAIIINTARGGVVNEDDLYDKMKTSEIRVAFDVFWNEPYSGKLMEFYPDRFYATPHIASSCKEFFEDCFKDFNLFINE